MFLFFLLFSFSLYEYQIGKAKKVFTALEELMDTKNNYRQYRQEVAEAALHLPCLPYFGIYLRDFTFIDVGNPAYLTKKMVNVNRLLLMWNVAKEMDRCQSVDFHFEEEITSFSQNLKTAIQTIGTQSTDDRLYHFSHLCEPNTGTGDGIVASASATSLSLINTTVVVSSSSPDTSPFSSSH